MPIFEEPSPLNAAAAGLATYLQQKRANQAAATAAAAFTAQQTADAQQRAAAAAAAAEQERYSRSEDAKHDALAQSRENRDAAASAATTAKTQSEAVIAPGQRNPFTGKIEGKFGTYGYQQAHIKTQQAQATLQKTIYENSKSRIDNHFELATKQLDLQLKLGQLTKEQYDIKKAQQDALYAGALHQAELQSHLAAAAHSAAGTALDYQRLSNEQDPAGHSYQTSYGSALGRAAANRAMGIPLSDKAAWGSLSPSTQNLMRQLKGKGWGVDQAAHFIGSNRGVVPPADLNTLLTGGLIDKVLGRGVAVKPPSSDQRLDHAYQIYQAELSNGADAGDLMAKLTKKDPVLAVKLQKLLKQTSP